MDAAKFFTNTAIKLIGLGKVDEADGIVKGKVLYTDNSQGGKSLLKYASNLSHVPSHVLAMSDESGVKNDMIRIVYVGEVSGLNTSGYTENPSVLHLITNGDMQSAEPSEANIVHMGHCTYSHVNQGKVYFNPKDHKHTFSASSDIDLRIILGDRLGARGLEFYNYGKEELLLTLDSLGFFKKNAVSANIEAMAATAFHFKCYDMTAEQKHFYAKMPFSGTLTGIYMYSPDSGDLTVDVTKITHASFPTFASIVGAGTKPNFDSTQKYLDESLTDWSKDFDKGDIFDIEIEGTPVDITQFSLIGFANKKEG